MAFLDEKENVLEVELTSYGKRLLADGKFKPTYYSFHDEHVMYDSAYSGQVETQNSASIRIREAPQSNAQASYNGAEEKRKRQDYAQTTNEKLFVLPYALGNSSLTTDKGPAWSVKLLRGVLTGSTQFLTGSHQTARVPQLDLTIKYETAIGEGTADKTEDAEDLRPVPIDDVQDRVYEDGSYIDVREDYILLQIEEKNVDFSNENFDIEVFLVETSNDPVVPGGIRNELVPMKFVKRKPLVQNNLLVENEEPLKEEYTTENTEYFIDIFIDEEIDRQIFCENKESDSRRSIFADKNTVCDISSTEKMDIYKESDDDFEDDC